MNPWRPAPQTPRPDSTRTAGISARVWTFRTRGAVLLAAAALLAPACSGNNPATPDAADPGGDGGSRVNDGLGGGGLGGSNGAGGDRGTGGGPIVSTGGRSGSGGATGLGGRVGLGVGGRLGVLDGAGGTVIVAPASCGSTTHNLNPFGCELAWGMDNPGNSLAAYTYLKAMSYWIGSEARADGTLGGCNGCSWLTRNVAPVANLIPAYYGYIIGFYGHANGLPDGNQNPSGPNLTTGGANLIRNNRAKIIQMYASYAQQTHAVWATKPLIWLLEGDFVQYAGTSQANPLSYSELAQLAEDISCAIKANMPNAVVAINHSTWNANEVTDRFWAAMRGVNYDITWTSGVGNANGFFATGTTAATYNGATATYAYLHRITGRTIFVDTSFGLSAIGDSWSNAGAANVNARIADGVVAVNVTNPDGNYRNNIAALGTLSSTCAP